ncbi:hypothetical protein LAWI1_G002366 [Lachnellula willkommii]|uniref:Uncharacterized protein n=1 Tax=Lachnellula willkommii TaxID=215461 RepID=A0A559MI90_9HELO|nr:hypothetical protein LAWI1_G002366 [Lachnellula willkommii]
MPPSGTPPQSNEGQVSTGNQEPYYSNEDVAILHDIVTLAQELLPRLPERERLPTNALFNAYYDILPRLGLNADHDSRYARVLFKIGGLRAEGTLYERFEEVLARMGIEIEFANEDEGEFSQPEDSQDHIENATVGTTPPEDENVESKTHRRRNSESSFWDQGTPTAPQRRNSFSSAAQVAHQPGRPQFLQEIQPRKLPASNPPPNHEDLGGDGEHPYQHILAYGSTVNHNLLSVDGMDMVSTLQFPHRISMKPVRTQQLRQLWTMIPPPQSLSKDIQTNHKNLMT